jgi:hypothetical protein
MDHGTRKAIQFRHDENVAFSAELKRGFQLRALSHRTDLFAEDFLASRLFQLIQLRFESCHLIDSRCPRVSDVHFRVSLLNSLKEEVRMVVPKSRTSLLRRETGVSREPANLRQGGQSQPIRLPHGTNFPRETQLPF